MRVLLLTGRLAADDVRKAAEDFEWAEVKVLPIDVAALMTTRFVIEQLRGEDLARYDYILLPGWFRGDVRKLDEALDADFRLSSREARDLPLVLRKMEEGFVPSKDVPACVLLRDEILRELGRKVRDAERDIPERSWIDVGPVRIARGCRPRVLSEVFADDLSPEEAASEAERRAELGAEIVDLGFHERSPEDVRQIVETVRDRVGDRVAVSVDSGDPGILEAGAEAGADILLNAFPDLKEPVDLAAEYDVPVVLVPENKKPEIAVRQLRELVGLCERRDVDYVLDPVMDPPGGIVESIVRYRAVAEEFPEAPLFFGAGNVLELIDADSPGTSALCAQIAVELECSIIFTPEASGKTKMSTLELAVASRMCYVAHKFGGFPKDVGLDLVVFKDKRVDSVSASGLDAERFASEPQRDVRGDFVILTDHDRGVLILEHRCGDDEPLRLESDDGLELGAAAVSLGLLSDLRHALYLGYELARAEERLKSYGQYIQDDGIERYDRLLRDLKILEEVEER
ncbi:dihydropteroate synthase-like protein [Methanopyrus kandleri]